MNYRITIKTPTVTRTVFCGEKMIDKLIDDACKAGATNYYVVLL